MSSVIERNDRPAGRAAKKEERRAASRYLMQTTVRYRRAGRFATLRWKTGRCVNMSAGGILLEVSEDLAAGSRLEISLDWTGLYHGVEKMRLFLTGWVVRADERGTALRIAGHTFREVPAPPRAARAERNLRVA